MLLVVVGPAQPRPIALLPPSSDGKPEAATAVAVAPDDGREDARKKLRSFCIFFVDSVESMMMHGLANPKFKNKYQTLRTHQTGSVVIEKLRVPQPVKLSLANCT